jgi:membrane associated rhomboid family serine protease
MAQVNRGQGFMSNVPIVTKNLIIINALVWLATVVLGRMDIHLEQILGLHYVGSSGFFPTQLVTYMFMHDSSSFTHILFNMFAVFVFGRIIEQVWGPKRFLLFYFVTGIGAGLVQELTWYIDLRPFLQAVNDYQLNGDSSVLSNYLNVVSGVSYPIDMVVAAKQQLLNRMITVGASGAVFGILLAFGMLFPNAPLYLMFIPIPIKAKYMVIGYGLIEFFAGVSRFSGDNVAHFAHLGGMLFGFFMIRYWKKKGVGNGFYLG